MFLKESNQIKEKKILFNIPVDIVRCNPPLSCGPTCRLNFLRISRLSFSSFDVFSSLLSSDVIGGVVSVSCVPFQKKNKTDSFKISLCFY